ncbi:hypothetical protein [Desulfosporosinus sp.]|uniref:hypothetical protein n=1 Tax=Desulfosporosinus sp. TaxID=157907 RepID=UPI0025B8EF8A|nr:hypothetical protein [Desulfosporosinus sp.]MBC2724363.1 hypothetical protein [Desulfosporosinus sp.]MBC2726959.1 hypothetical protein [Desulfosporosinus sp.]
MISLEEYIARRKKEDHLNEFDLDARNENMRICVNYVFEYFNNYLNITEAEEKTALQNEKLSKYRQQLRDYEPEVREWLVNIYAEYGKQMNRNVGNVLKQFEFFFLYNSDSDFRSLSYDCYSQLVKKVPFLKDQTEMLFLFIKEYHRVHSRYRLEFDKLFISEGINEWLENTWTKYQVNILAFAFDWVHYFYDNENLWPSSHRKKSQETWRKYDYDIKQKGNLFNLDSLYRKMPKKSFAKGRKQEFEIIMMYYWLHDMEGDESGYWQEYLDKVLPSLNER